MSPGKRKVKHIVQGNQAMPALHRGADIGGMVRADLC